MRQQDMLTLYEYNDWANGRILSTAAQVSQDQFTAASRHSLGSLHSILLHALDTEYGWRMLCQHSQITPALSAADFPSVKSLEQRWQEAERPGLPPRHVYRLTAAGLALAREQELAAVAAERAGALA